MIGLAVDIFEYTAPSHVFLDLDKVFRSQSKSLEKLQQ